MRAMLDLKELERMLDESLKQETSESLKSWMINRKNQLLSNFVGDVYGYTSISSTFAEFTVASSERKECYSSNLNSQTPPNNNDLLNAA